MEIQEGIDYLKSIRQTDGLIVERLVRSASTRIPVYGDNVGTPAATAPTPARQQLIRQNIEDAQAVFRKTMEFVDQLASGYTADSGVPAGLLDTAIRALEHVGLMAKEITD